MTAILRVKVGVLEGVLKADVDPNKRARAEILTISFMVDG